jgi:mannosyltransferase OCH1-like enzyme
MIPKIIHQTWKTNIVPVQYNESVLSCQKNNPTYKYILWTDGDMNTFVLTHFPRIYDTYKSYPYNIQRCDAFRYMVLYVYGGIYIDLDIGCNDITLDNLIIYDLVLAKSLNTQLSYTNSVMMSTKGHDFMNSCIVKLPDERKSWSRYGKHIHVMNSTGPLYLTRCVHDYGNIPNLYELSSNDFKGDCNECNKNNGNCKGGVYFYHLPGQTWNSFDSRILNFIMCNYIKIFIVIILLNK